MAKLQTGRKAASASPRTTGHAALHDSERLSAYLKNGTGSVFLYGLIRIALARSGQTRASRKTDPFIPLLSR